MAILGTDPERTGCMIGLEMKPGKVVVTKDVGYKTLLLIAVGT